MFNSQFGLLNQWMIRLGMEPVRWLGSDVIAFISCTTVNLWLALPFMITIIDGHCRAWTGVFTKVRARRRHLAGADEIYYGSDDPLHYSTVGYDHDIYDF